MRLVGDLSDRDTDGKFGGDGFHRLFEVFSQRNDVAAFLHRDAKPKCRLSAFANEKCGWVLVTAFDGRDVAQPKYLALCLYRHCGDRIGAGESARHAKVNAIGGGINRSAGCHGVLPRHAVKDLLRGDAERGEFGVADLDKDFFGLRADQINLVHSGHAQQALADVFAQRF